MSRPVDEAVVWIYGGVWASVVALFRMPAGTPSLPTAGEEVRSLRPAPGFLRYLKFFFWLALVPGDVIPVVGWLAIFWVAPVLGLLLVPLLIVVAVAPDVLSYVAIHLRYDTTWYVLTDRSMRIRRGIWVIHETTISFENVQNVEVRQGPVQRHFGIADVVVTTAGGGSHAKGEAGGSKGAHVGLLQGLDDAERVRDLILERVKRTRSAGLGDDRPDATAHIAAGSPQAFAPAHLAVLRQIRDAARALASRRAF